LWDILQQGFYSKCKLTILIAQAFGITIKPETVFNLGINCLGKGISRYAREKGYKITLLAPGPRLTDSFYLDVLLACGSEYCLNHDDFSDVAEEYHAKEYHYISGSIDFRKLTGSSWIDRTNVSVDLLPLAQGKA